MKVVKNWFHKPGKHCGSTAIRDVMNYHGYRLSEPMCFGIGAGLGFFYGVSSSFSPTRVIMVRSASLESNFFEHIGVPFYWKTEDNDESAINNLKKCVDEGTPVLLQTDLYYIDYYNSKTHFSGHVVVAWGYDDNKKEVYLSDTHWEGLQKLGYESLNKARSSKHPPFNLSHNYFEVKNLPTKIDLEKVIVRAIKRQIDDLQGANMNAFESMKFLAEDFNNWKTAQDWKWCSRFAYQVIEKRGTGGGAFRRLYYQFLKEAGKIVEKLEDGGFADGMKEVAQQWTHLSETLKEISEKDKPEGFAEAAEIMRSIAVKEEKLFTDLKKVIE